jgi:hypothetical protein
LQLRPYLQAAQFSPNLTKFNFFSTFCCSHEKKKDYIENETDLVQIEEAFRGEAREMRRIEILWLRGGYGSHN